MRSWEVRRVFLLAEEIDPATGTQLGNFPQAFSHIGLINSVVYLNRARGIEHPGPELRGVGSSPHIDDE